MIGFSIMMWFCSALLIFVSFSLLKGNYSSVHGKVFETTNDRKGYAKALGKPVLLIGICLLFSGVIAVILPKDYAISIAVIFILFIAVICSIWLYKIQKDFRKSQFDNFISIHTKQLVLGLTAFFLPKFQIGVMK